MKTFLGFSDFRSFWKQVTAPRITGEVIRSGGWTHFVRESMWYTDYPYKGFIDRIKFWLRLPSVWKKFNRLNDVAR